MTMRKGSAVLQGLVMSRMERKTTRLHDGTNDFSTDKGSREDLRDVR